MSTLKSRFQKLPKLIVILGPTASGKTDLAIKLAKKLAPYRTCSGTGFNGVEIVSADSRQVYKEMDIATAKPLQTKNHAPYRNEVSGAGLKLPEGKPSASYGARKTKNYFVKGINHHLIDVVYPNQEFNVAIYKKLAIKAIKNIQKQGKLPFLVGGTGLYIQAIVDNIDFPKVSPKKKLREKLEKKTEKELFAIYKKLDPKGAKFIDKENKRRLIRAIEVCKVTKKPFWQQRKKKEPLFNILQIGIKLPKTELKKRIKKRVEKMFTPLEIAKAKKKHEKSKSLTGFKLGLEKEVQRLVKKYGWISPLQTIGYQEWRGYLENKIKKSEVKEKIKIHTVQFAKRQMTWFKRDRRIHWTPPTHHPYRYAEKLVRKFLKTK